MKNLFLIMLLQLTLSSNAFAQGEDKLGPNQGFIRMPGAFHTELVPYHDGSFYVYLMDVNNKNPVTKNSSVKLTLNQKKEVNDFSCIPMDGDGHFFCKPESQLDLKSGKIVLKAVRLGIKANEAIYELPLSLKGKKNQETPVGHDMDKMQH